MHTYIQAYMHAYLYIHTHVHSSLAQSFSFVIPALGGKERGGLQAWNHPVLHSKFLARRRYLKTKQIKLKLDQKLKHK